MVDNTKVTTTVLVDISSLMPKGLSGAQLMLVGGGWGSIGAVGSKQEHILGNGGEGAAPSIETRSVEAWCGLPLSVSLPRPCNCTKNRRLL